MELKKFIRSEYMQAKKPAKIPYQVKNDHVASLLWGVRTNKHGPVIHEEMLRDGVEIENLYRKRRSQMIQEGQARDLIKDPRPGEKSDGERKKLKKLKEKSGDIRGVSFKSFESFKKAIKKKQGS